ncbi:MAG: hypothetical protein HOC20_11695 [Chloroflexi bacterium]|jgi:hypothetical protein|nr:hypothetical protein [Chloroflexota bacterium]
MYAMEPYDDSYELEAKNQLKQMAVGAVVTLTVGTVISRPDLVRAGIALGAAGLVGLLVLAALNS